MNQGDTAFVASPCIWLQVAVWLALGCAGVVASNQSVTLTALHGSARQLARSGTSASIWIDAFSRQRRRAGQSAGLWSEEGQCGNGVLNRRQTQAPSMVNCECGPVSFGPQRRQGRRGTAPPVKPQATSFSLPRPWPVRYNQASGLFHRGRYLRKSPRGLPSLVWLSCERARAGRCRRVALRKVRRADLGAGRGRSS
jgi:hypothetical protein